MRGEMRGSKEKVGKKGETGETGEKEGWREGWIRRAERGGRRTGGELKRG